jgi:hypothetical protein
LLWNATLKISIGHELGAAGREQRTSRCCLVSKSSIDDNSGVFMASKHQMIIGDRGKPVLACHGLQTKCHLTDWSNQCSAFTLLGAKCRVLFPKILFLVWHGGLRINLTQG